MTLRARLVGLVLVGLVALGGRAAHAQGEVVATDRKATATALFKAGQELVANGRAEDACPKFEESYRLLEANGTLINLADCYERIGKTASAWLTFREVAQRSRRDGQDARAVVADDRARELEPRLTKLLVRVGPNAAVEGLVVERDGVVLGPPALDVAVPVDPGPHRVAVRAPGYASWETRIDAAGEGKVVELTLPTLRATGSAASGATSSDAGSNDAGSNDAGSNDAGSNDAGSNDTGRSSDVRPWQAPMGIALFALGGAGVVAGVALGGAAKAKADGADCDDDDRCTPAGLEARDRAVTLGNVGTGTGIAGAVLGGLGLTLWLTAPDDETSVGVHVRPGGLFAAGRF